MGHPAPFNLKMIGVGNEQWGPRYVERYKRVRRGAQEEASRDIAGRRSAGPGSSGKEFEYLWTQSARSLKADIVDEHYYMAPHWFLAERAPLRQLRSQRAQGLRRRVRGADVGIARPGQPQQLGSARSPRPRSSPVWSGTPTS